GKAGIEKVYDLALRGKGGNKKVEVNALGRVIREMERNEGETGAEIQLSLDIELQKYAMKKLKNKSAAVVVMDIHTGSVLTLASTPSFDPNAFNKGLSFKEWSSLSSNPNHPLVNKATSGRYSPGSTFKMIVALAALEAGVISPEQKVICKGHIELGNRRFHCWKKEGHGAVNLKEAIQHSCDIYFYEIAKRVGINRIAKMAKRFGLGEVSGIDLPNESNGLIPDKAWKKQKVGDAWRLGDTYNAGIGQGFVLTTPLQLAVMTARIANGGIAVTPHVSIQKKDTDDKEDSFPAMDISRANLQIIKDAMNSVVNAYGGTAFGSRFKVKNATMSGKTGTTQVRRISMQERTSEGGVRKQEDIKRKLRNHALFVGFAPSDSPKYAISVLVEHGGSGSKAAAPIARDVLRKAIRINSSRTPDKTKRTT
ncbi:MAG: penicillin-binding protein 2, partial [Alphaproteobacteria bacterium]|nr:penicillin-binding protein 2 [Alphaproteobacteria bacterium]